MDIPFEGKTVLVTGSGRGIGREIALYFARRGADVAVNFFRNRAPAEETCAAILALGRRSVAIKAHVGKIEGIQTLFDQFEQHFEMLDIFINNAASGYNRSVMEQKPEGWDWTMNINARAFLFACQRAAPLIEARGGGAIVAISSPGAHRVIPEYSVVGASKAALESLVRYLAVELAPRRIAVNAVSPGVVDTDALRHFSAMEDPELLTRAGAHSPAGRLVTPQDVAGVVGFLCSPEACMIRGQVIAVDGGLSLLPYEYPVRKGKKGIE